MYDGSPGEIDFGSSWREVRVSEGSSHRESTLVFKRQFQPLRRNLTETFAPYSTKIAGKGRVGEVKLICLGSYDDKLD